MSDDVMDRMGRAVEQGRAGDRAGARTALEELWTEIAEAGDPLHRSSIAHFLADLQDTVADELVWDHRALDAVTSLTDARAREFHDSLQARGFLPSMHLNLADAYRRAGDPAAARHHLTEAAAHCDALPDDDYGAFIKQKITEVGEKVARLPS